MKTPPLSNLLISFALVAAPLLVACSGAEDAPASSDSNLTATTPMPDSLHWFRDSAEYQAGTRQAYLLATMIVTNKVSNGYAPGSWGVVVDADETVLDNSEFEKEGWQQGVDYTPARWSAWVQRKEAKAIPGSVAFTQKVHALGGKVVVVTNRAAADCPASQENMKQLGLVFDAALCQTDVSDKNPRFASIAAGTTPGLPALEIVLYVGDNILDFPAQSQDIRTQGDSAFTDFGSRFVTIPNPVYGSWQTNPAD